MAPRGSRLDVMEADISYDMQRLFDHYNFDHIPVEKRLNLFKQRDLPHIKHYKAAVKIFGGPQRRTRAIVAPPMETPLKHRLGLYHNVFVPPPPPVVNGPLKPTPEPVKQPTKEEKAQMEEDEKVANYKSWIGKRKALRGDLDNLGLNEAFLARKPNKTELEERVQAKFRADRLWKPESPPPPEVVPTPKPLPDVPEVTVPPPDGLQILDKFLSLNRMRLMDLFLIADKDKSWTLSRQEFLNAVTQAAIPLTASEVDDIVITLDVNLDDELSYQEINKGLQQWRKHRRDVKREGGGDKAASTNARLAKGDTKPGSTQPQKISRSQSKEDAKESKVGSAQAQRISRSQSKEDARESKAGSKEQSRASKAPSRELSKEKISVEKTPKVTPMQTPRDKPSQESTKKTHSRAGLSREISDVGKETEEVVAYRGAREISDLSKKSLSEAGANTEEDSLNDLTNADISLSASQQRVRTSEAVSSHMLYSRENASADKTASATLPLDSQMDKSLYEDVLFQSEDTPAAGLTAQDIGEEEDRGDDTDTGTQERKPTSSATATGTRPGSHKSSSGSRSRTSTPNSLEPPELDMRQEAMVPHSDEAMLDIRKHDRVVLSRNNIRRSLSREKRITFDEIPGVIKVGYKPIDDHCSESTLAGENSEMINRFRREKLKEYFEVMKLFEETGLPFTQKTLDRVLLYPGDRPTNAVKKNIVLPMGPLVDEFSPFNQPKPKKRSKKRRRGLGRLSRASGLSGDAGGAIGANGAGGGSGGRGRLGMRGGGSAYDDDERSSSSSARRSYLTVEDVYPFASHVTPKVYKENLSSGRALVTRKIDNWMTFEEYNKYTKNLPNRFKHFNRKSDPDAAWPGSMLDKVRLYMDHEMPFVDGRGRPLENRDSAAYEGYGTGIYNGRGNAVFRCTEQPKRAYPGYNNDLLTWPVGENGVRYANIDEHRLVK